MYLYNTVCISLALYLWICMYLSGSVCISLALYLLICLYLFGSLSISQALSVSLWLCLYLTGSVFIYLALSVSIWLYQYISGSVSLSQALSVSLWLYFSSSILYLCLYLLEIVCISLAKKNILNLEHFNITFRERKNTYPQDPKNFDHSPPERIPEMSKITFQFVLIFALYHNSNHIYQTSIWVGGQCTDILILPALTKC